MNTNMQFPFQVQYIWGAFLYPASLLLLFFFLVLFKPVLISCYHQALVVTCKLHVTSSFTCNVYNFTFVIDYCRGRIPVRAVDVLALRILIVYLWFNFFRLDIWSDAIYGTGVIN